MDPLESLNTESNTYLTPSLVSHPVDNFSNPKNSKFKFDHRLLGALPPPARGLWPPRSRFARSPTRHPPARPSRAALNGHAFGVKISCDNAINASSLHWHPPRLRRHLRRPTGLPLCARPTPVTPEKPGKTAICSRHNRVQTVIQRLTCCSMPTRRYRMTVQALPNVVAVWVGHRGNYALYGLPECSTGIAGN